jgi:hypothetical protein
MSAAHPDAEKAAKTTSVPGHIAHVMKDGRFVAAWPQAS